MVLLTGFLIALSCQGPAAVVAPGRMIATVGHAGAAPGGVTANASPRHREDTTERAQRALHAQNGQAPTAAAAEAGQTADAYYQFLLGRMLERDDRGEEAVKAVEKAVTMDPGSAELRSELASMLLRQGRGDEAAPAAEAALKLDARNAEAHWVLGTILATRALGSEGGQTPSPEDIGGAIEHFEQALWDRRYDLGMQVTLGRLYLARGDALKAVDVLRNVVEQEPGALEAAWLYAQALEGAGRTDAAADALREIVSDEPRFFRAWISLGELYERQGRYRDAAEAYGRAAEQNTRSTELKLRQAQALLAGGDATAARDLMRGVVAATPTDPTSLYLLSTAEREAKDLDAAETAARRLMALDASDLRGPYALAQVQEDRHDFAAVVAALAPAVERARGKPEPRSRLFARSLAFLGFAYTETGDTTKAIATFEQAREAGDPNAEGYLAQAQIANGDTAAALATVERARRERPRDLMLSRVQAQALQRSGRSGEAVAVMQDAVKHHPEQLESWLSLADAQAEAEQVADAMRTLDDAGRRFARDARVPFQRGAILEQKKRHAEAETAFRAALALDPLHAPTLNYLGYMLVERGERLEEATRLIQRAVEIDPGNPSYLDSLGWAWYKRGDLQKARPSLERAADRLPRNSVVQDHYGDVLAALADPAGAVAAWERALAGDREQIDAATVKTKIDRARSRKP